MHCSNKFHLPQTSTLTDNDVITHFGLLDLQGDKCVSNKDITKVAIDNCLHKIAGDVYRNKKKKVCEIIVPASDTAVVEYNNPDLWYGAYTSLFEYGFGAPECPLRNKYGSKISLEE